MVRIAATVTTHAVKETLIQYLGAAMQGAGEARRDRRLKPILENGPVYQRKEFLWEGLRCR